MDLTETRKQWQQAWVAAKIREREALHERLVGPGVPMYDPSLGRIVYVTVDWPERNRF